jgi:predicted transcriptional regulator of viral defense system
MMTTISGISKASRRQLTRLHRNTRGIVGVAEAASLLNADHVRTAKLLAHWAAQGWTRRLHRGLYLLIPLEANSPGEWTTDPWLLADRLFDPGYIAGWSACEHWGFTEQVFNDIAVFTSARIRQRKVTVDRFTFALRKINKRLIFGTTTIWRGNAPIQVSDPTRTLLDVLDAPRWAGGMRHAGQVCESYFESTHRNEELLIVYLERLNNAAIAKRLGFLLETMQIDSRLIEPLRRQLSSGYALLDPSVAARGKFSSRWRLRINVRLD